MNDSSKDQRAQQDFISDDNLDLPGVTFDSITVSDMCVTPMRLHGPTEAFTTLDIVCPDRLGRHFLKVKVDTGASANTLPVRTMKRMYGDKWKSLARPTDTHLTAYNGSTIMCHGFFHLMCSYKGSDWSREKFFIGDVPGPAVAGLPMSQKLQRMTIHAVSDHDSNSPTRRVPHTDSPSLATHSIKSIDDLKRLYPNQLDTLGSFKTKARLHLQDDATPHIYSPRKCSIYLKEKLKNEIDKMEQDGVIRPVTHHTDWCSSLTTSVKKYGSLRLCLDPKCLNDNLKRCPHKVPTLEELNPEFSQAKFFSKLDAKAGYWSVH